MKHSKSKSKTLAGEKNMKKLSPVKVPSKHPFWERIKKKTEEIDVKEIDLKNIPKVKFDPISTLFGIFRGKKKDGPKRSLTAKRKQDLKYYFERAGIFTEPALVSNRILVFAIILNSMISFFGIYWFSYTIPITIVSILFAIIMIWGLFFLVLIFLIWMLYYSYLDVRIFKRKLAIEDVLPDYLQLTASNIKAGMTIDRALWFAVRPRFGVLAKEIEIVAKDTMKGVDLKIALQSFAEKYDSTILRRSISLLIEGVESGGEIGSLLNKIAINIQEGKILRREMSANLTTYVIFISFATVAAAPVLFALSGVLIRVITTLGGSLGDATEGSGFLITFSGSGIAYADFKIFAMVSLVMTSIFSAIIVATIRKGDAKAGLKYIPLFMIVTLTLFLVADFFMGKLIGLVI